jgi:hypothetical protein
MLIDYDCDSWCPDAIRSLRLIPESDLDQRIVEALFQCRPLVAFESGYYHLRLVRSDDRVILVPLERPEQIIGVTPAVSSKT